MNGRYAIAGARLGYAQFEANPAFPINDQAVMQDVFDRLSLHSIVLESTIGELEWSISANPLEAQSRESIPSGSPASGRGLGRQKT